MTTNIKEELWEQATLKGEKMYIRLGSWLNFEKAFDELDDDNKYAYIMTALGKSKPKEKKVKAIEIPTENTSDKEALEHLKKIRKEQDDKYKKMVKEQKAKK